MRTTRWRGEWVKPNGNASSLLHFQANLFSQCGGRAGLNEREAPGKVVTARPPKRFGATRFKFVEAPVKNVKTDTIWQPTLQRQLGVTMYGGSSVPY